MIRVPRSERGSPGASSAAQRRSGVCRVGSSRTRAFNADSRTTRAAPDSSPRALATGARSKGLSPPPRTRLDTPPTALCPLYRNLAGRAGSRALRGRRLSTSGGVLATSVVAEGARRTTRLGASRRPSSPYRTAPRRALRPLPTTSVRALTRPSPRTSSYKRELIEQAIVDRIR